MKREYILFIDSGVGGLSTLAEAMRFSPANFIYFADNLHSPYGDRSNEEIFELLKTLIKGLLKKFEIKIVVLACNTATTSSIKHLREEFKSLTFVGTEPALRLASKGGASKVLCLVTPLTARQLRYRELERESGTASGKIFTLSLPGLAQNIEHCLLSNNFSDKALLLRDICQIFSAAEHKDAIVLGCTHYVFLKNILKTKLNLPVFDGNFGVAKQIQKLSPLAQQKSTVKFMFSKSEPGLAQKYEKILKQTLANKEKLC